MTEHELIRALLECCRNAQGAYEFLSDIGAGTNIPGLKRTMVFGKETIKEAEEYLRA